MQKERAIVPLEQRLHRLAEKFIEIANNGSIQDAKIYFPTILKLDDGDREEIADLVDDLHTLASIAHKASIDILDNKIIFERTIEQGDFDFQKLMSLKGRIDSEGYDCFERKIKELGYDDTYARPLGQLVTAFCKQFYERLGFSRDIEHD